MVVFPAARAQAADRMPNTYGAFLVAGQYTEYGDARRAQR
jgi:hypothetical protein